MTNRLTLKRALESSGMPQAAAEHVATEICNAIYNNVATKADLRELEQQLDARFEALERQFSRMVTRLGVLVVVRIGILLVAVAGVVGGVGGVLYYWK